MSWISLTHVNYVLYLEQYIMHLLIIVLAPCSRLTHTMITCLIYTDHMSYTHWSHVLYTVIRCHTYTDHMSCIHCSRVLYTLITCLAYTAHMSYIYWSHVLHMYSNHMFRTQYWSHVIYPLPWECTVSFMHILITFIYLDHMSHIHVPWSRCHKYLEHMSQIS